MVQTKLKPKSITQYQIEERSILVKRLFDTKDRLESLVEAMKSTKLAPDDHIAQLQEEIYQVTLDVNFRNANSMGEIVQAALSFMERNYRFEDE